VIVGPLAAGVDKKMPAPVFVDNSNIFGGARRTASFVEAAAPWQAIRLYFRNFARLTEGSHSVATRVLAGSVPPGNEDLWEYARQAGSDTRLLNTIGRDDGRLGEQGVDELLQLKIAYVLIDYGPPQTLILGTGDGGAGEFDTSFERQVSRALKCGWDVEVWSWGMQLSGRFAKLRSPNGTAPKVQVLDPYYRSITFVKGGYYTVDGSKRAVAPRVVERL
jgi:hypothetical protein